MKPASLLARPALLLAALAALALPHAVRAEEPSAPRKLVEIYRVAPGRHLEFLQMIAQFDQASREAGIPPRDLYVHQDGAGWDFMLIQNAEYTDEQSEKLGKVMERMGLPRGANFFIEFRKNIIEHSDTFVEGPTTAEAWLRKLK
jgi:membrane-bound lytic murein transglycosylase B